MFFIFLFHFSTSFRTIAVQCGHRRPPTRTWVTAGTAAVAPTPAPSPAQRTDPVAPTRSHPHYLGHGNAPLPRSTQAAAATAATHHPLYHASSSRLIFGIQVPPRLIPQASQVPIAASAPPHASSLPVPTPSRRASPTLSQRASAHRPFKACNHPPRHGAQPPAAPATSSRHANTCCIRHLTSHKLVLVVSLLYILYYCNEYIF